MNQYDVGAKEDFNNMTEELGKIVTVYVRNDTLNYEDQQSDQDFYDAGTEEIAVIQELSTKHEVVQSGQFNVGDVKFTFKSDSVVSEESKVTNNNRDYKVMRLSVIRGMNNDKIMYIKAYGKKLPKR